MSPRARRALWAIAGLGLVARVVSWWLQGGFHYPDEIFQQVEPAHYWRTGVAFIPWEFERGLRSWALPALYAALLELLSWFGVTGLSALRVVTLHNALLTVVMVPAGYRIGAAIFSDDPARRETAGLASAFFIAVLPGVVYWGPHTLIGTPTMVLAAWGYAYWLEARTSSPANAALVLRAGLFFGSVGALRATAGLHLLVPIVDLLWRGRLRAFRLLALGAALPLMVVGAVDALTWGSPFHSTIEHLRYNAFEGGATGHHGTEPWFFYWTRSWWGQLGPLAPVFWAVIVCGARRSWPLVLAVVLPTVALSLLPNKQDRFLMYNWPLLAGALSAGCVAIATVLRRRATRAATAAGVALAFALVLSNGLGASELPWTLRRGMFRSQAFVGARSDASGLLLDDRQHMNGGYLVFGRTVPQVEFARSRLRNPLYNYAALARGGADAGRLRAMGWLEVATFDDIVVLQRPAGWSPTTRLPWLSAPAIRNRLFDTARESERSE